MKHYIFVLFFIFPVLANANVTGSQKKTICLNMIVKNESHVITRCLKSVLPFIDYWVIVDTGSTDGTQQVIKDFMKENNIPGELYERPWVNFGHNRQEALELAKSKADYLLFIDADDILTYPEGYQLPELIYDIYMINGNAEQIQYHLLTIVKSSLDWHWRDPIHEHLECMEARVAGILSRIQYIYMHDGARSKDPQVIQKDILLLKECAEKDPDNPRYQLFLGQAYRAASNNEESLKHYRRRSEMGGSPEEAYWSLLQVAQILTEQKADPKEIERSYLKAYEFRPSRHEAIYYLANFYREHGDPAKAYEIALKGVNMESSPDTLSREKGAYEATFIEFAYSAFLLGKYKESVKACQKVIKTDQLPNRFIEMTKKLRGDALEKIREKKVHQILNGPNWNE